MNALYCWGLDAEWYKALAWEAPEPPITDDGETFSRNRWKCLHAKSFAERTWCIGLGVPRKTAVNQKQCQLTAALHAALI